MHISETSGPIAIQFNLKHKWDREKGAIYSKQDRTRTVVPTATDSSHRVIMGETLFSCFLGCFDRTLLILEVIDDIHTSLAEFDIPPDLTKDYGVSFP